MEITFTAKVQALGRVAIPKDVREALRIAKGDLVTLKVRKITEGDGKATKVGSVRSSQELSQTN